MSLKITYIYFHIGYISLGDSKDEYQNDLRSTLFTIYNGGITLYGCAGGHSSPPQANYDVVSTQNELRFRLQTRDVRYAGYLLHYESE